MAKKRRFTIYDKLEEDGVFESNPANSTANPEVLEAAKAAGTPVWPVPYPRMLYHPQGERRVTVAGEIIMTPLGPKEVGRQTELVWQVANNQAEHKALLAQGWHESPADAQAVANGRTPEDEAEDLAVQIRELEARRNAKLAKAGVQASAPVGTRIKASPQTEPLAAGSLPSGAAA